MNRIRVGLTITAILGVIYAAAGLLNNLTEFGVGAAVAAAAIAGYGLCDFIDDHHNEQIRRTRNHVWARRDNQEADTYE
jgi:hypothetical protein